MKKLFVIAAALVALPALAQPAQKGAEEKDGFTFTVVKENPVTSVKNQASSGTCWCFSALSLAESEAIRLGTATKDNIDLAEMFVVANTYIDRAVKYVRTDGHVSYGQGSSCKDAFYSMRDHGIVPEEAMKGLNYGSETHRHGELAAACKGFVQAIATNPNKKLTPTWKSALKGILEAYLGPIPEKFELGGKEYTPQEYFATLKLNPEDYIDFTSWTHVPYYKPSPVEVGDNWRWEYAYNVPLDEMIAIFDHALQNGFTIAWGADVSEPGFTRNGIAVYPDPEFVNKAKERGSDEARWLGVTTAANSKYDIKGPVKEIEVTDRKSVV